MKKHKILKRTAAALFAMTFASGFLPGMKGSLPAQSSPLTAEAAESAVGNPLMIMTDYDFNEDQTYMADVEVQYDSVINIGKENRCTVTIDGELAVGENAEIHLYNGSFLIITGNLDLYGNCRIICEDNSKVILHNQTVTEHSIDGKTPEISVDDFVIATEPNFWNTCSFDISSTVNGDLYLVSGAETKITNSSCVTVNGNMRIAGNLHIDDGSYLIVYGSLSLLENAKVTCDGNAKVILYSSNGTVPVSVSPTATCDINDFAGTDIKNLTYVQDWIDSKVYFKANGVYYTFDGIKFSTIAENPATIDLKEICTVPFNGVSTSSDVYFSQAAYDAYNDAGIGIMDDGDLKTGLVGYTIDGETCDKMYLAPNDYSIFLSNILYPMFKQTAGYGAAYVVTSDEMANIVSPGDAPDFSQVKAMVGFDLTMNLLYDTSSTSSLDNYKVVVSGPCAENGENQVIEDIDYSGTQIGSGVKATIPINYISDTVSVQLYYKDIPVGNRFNTSMEKYYEVLSSKGGELKEISDAILVYGKASSNYFNKNNAPTDISNEIAAYKDKYMLNDVETVKANFPEKFVPTATPDEVRYSMVLDSTVTLRCYLAWLENESIRDQFTASGVSVGRDDNGYYLYFSGLNPFDMFNKVWNITIDKKYNCSCCAWVYRVLTESKFENDTELKDLAVAIYAYANAGFDLFAAYAN